MQIKWRNVFALALLVTAIVVAIKSARQIAAALSALGEIGPGHSPEDKMVGLIVLGLLGAIIVALARILSRNDASAK